MRLISNKRNGHYLFLAAYRKPQKYHSWLVKTSAQNIHTPLGHCRRPWIHLFFYILLPELDLVYAARLTYLSLQGVIQGRRRSYPSLPHPLRDEFHRSVGTHLQVGTTARNGRRELATALFNWQISVTVMGARTRRDVTQRNYGIVMIHHDKGCHGGGPLNECVLLLE